MLEELLGCLLSSGLQQMMRYVCQGWHLVMGGVRNCVPFVDVPLTGVVIALIDRIIYYSLIQTFSILRMALRYGRC